MKHINKFNESKQPLLDEEYINSCFIDIIDMYDTDIRYEEKEEQRIIWEEWIISIKLPGALFTIKDTPIDQLISERRIQLEIMEEVKYSLEKIKVKYPNLNIHITTRMGGTLRVSLADRKIVFKN